MSIDDIKIGDGVFIKGLKTPGVIIAIGRLHEEAHYLVVYGNLAMQRKEENWFSRHAFIRGRDYER